MFPSKGWRKEMRWRRTHPVSESVFSFSPIFGTENSLTPNRSEMDKKAGEEFPQQHGVMFVVLDFLDPGVSREAAKIRVISQRSDSQPLMDSS